MNIKARNLKYLIHCYRDKSSAHKAIWYFKHRSNAWLKKTLRHHDEKKISDHKTWRRDEFDYLLGFYGILEIASLAGFIDEHFESDFKKQSLKILGHPAIRRYYEQNYPLLLPSRFLLRLEGVQDDRLEPNPKIIPAFYAFLELTKVIEEDKDVEEFLWMLEDGQRYDPVIERWRKLKHLLKVLHKPDQFCELLVLSKSRRGVLGRAAHGFCKFLSFCRAFDRLLNELVELPQLCNAFWNHHVYWFREFKKDVGAHLQEALSSISAWEKLAGQSVSDINDLKKVLSRLHREPVFVPTKKYS